MGMSDAPRPMPEILAELQAAADEVTAQRLHFGYIADTIRVNALRNGATTEQVEDFIHGRASFVNWIAELVEARGKTENAALQSRVAELEAANRGLVRLNEATEARAEAAEAALARAYMAGRDDAAKRACGLFRMQASGLYGAINWPNYGTLTEVARSAILAISVPADLAKRLGVSHD